MLIADLHIHSKYSRATSRDGVPEHLDFWARRKGIGLLGTGDFTHPGWRKELSEKLAPAEDGLYTLREEYRIREGPEGCPRFVLSGEISSIYKKNGRTRKVHNVILLPSLEAAEALSHRLEAIGNLHSDGRPILGLDSRDLLEITLEACPEAVFIPAHIWTPHFSLFGAFSGFDTIGECFEDLASHIHALETGLSSDPPMNWRLSALDGYTLVSNSDAHSPSKLGREANLLDIELSYAGLSHAIQSGEGFLGTIEFFPEEGKYHYDGHRSCKLCLSPAEAEEYGGKCPVCGKKLTIGVEHRVEQLADRAEGFRPASVRPFESLAPLPEVIGASTGASAAGVRVLAQYEAMLRELGPEFTILREAPLEELRRVAGPCVAEGIRRLREGEVERTPGYDGEYGTIRLLSKEEIDGFSGQTSLFAGMPAVKKRAAARRTDAETAAELAVHDEAAVLSGELNPEQQEAAASAGVAAVIAGPGTGKTKTLVSRIVRLLEEGVKPDDITAVTFTNRAAGELRERLEAQLGKRAIRGMTVGTFHAICLSLLEEWEGGVSLADEYDALEAASEAVRLLGLKWQPRRFLQAVSRRKNGAEAPGLTDEAFGLYCDVLRKQGMLDFDDLLTEVLAGFPEKASPAVRRRFSHLLADEFQDCSTVQYELLRVWNGGDLFVIGDPDQSIYGFRGADAGCFDRLRADFPGLREIRLLQNYRSTPEILSCALPLIEAGGGGARPLTPQLPSGAPVRLLTAESPLSEGIAAAKEINRMVGGVDMLDAQDYAPRRENPRSFSEIAVLYRTHQQAETLEFCLRREGIPYVVAGRDDFLADSAVRGTLCFFRQLSKPQDVSALRACLKLLWSCPEDLRRALSGRTGAAPSELEAAYREVSVLAPYFRLTHLFQPRIAKVKPRKLLEDFAAECGLASSPAYEKLLNTAVFHGDMPSFVQALLLGQEGDLRRSSGRDYAAGAVNLMTLHGSKGLEFPVVLLCGVRKDCIPLAAAADLAEERRLFYVGMTRAREELLLLGGPAPSPFLSDIPASRLRAEHAAAPRRSPEGVQLSLF